MYLTFPERSSRAELDIHMEPDAPRQFSAFISYSHTDNVQEGRRWAEWLHHGLESYVVPKGLRNKTNRTGEPIRHSLYPVFRDEEELTARESLGKLVEDALRRSEWLIVLCSPRSATSCWV